MAVVDETSLTQEHQGLVEGIRQVLFAITGLRFREDVFPDKGNGPGVEFCVQTTLEKPKDLLITVCSDAVYVMFDTAEARLENREAVFEPWAPMCCNAIRELLTHDLRVMLYRKAKTPRAIWFPGSGEGAWNGAGGPWSWPFFSEKRETIVTLRDWHHGLSTAKPATAWCGPTRRWSRRARCGWWRVAAARGSAPVVRPGRRYRAEDLEGHRWFFFETDHV